MFVRNKTAFEVALPHGQLMDGVFVAALVLEMTYRITPKGLVPWEGTRGPLSTDPPSTVDQALWHGASVTAAGTVFGPGRMPHIAYAELRVGNESRRLVVTGDRKWIKNAGKLVTSAPAPWEAMPLSWALAFGGYVDIPPGPVGPEKLPHPGGRFEYPSNPAGKGLCIDEAKAEGVALPNIESPDQLMKAPLDQPKPAGFAPCSELSGLRVPAEITPDSLKGLERALPLMLRMSHPAPGNLVFDKLAPGVDIGLTGVGRQPLRFGVPACPAAVDVQKGKKTTRLPAAVRGVHISADDGAVLVCFGHSFSYEEAPKWVVVTEA